MAQNLKDCKLEILFWHTRSVLERQNELHKILHYYDIFICVESWLKPNNRFHFPGFNTFRKDGLNSRSDGIVYFVEKKISFKEIKYYTIQNKEIETAGIRILNTSPSNDIATCYRIPGYNIS